ncbi:MAG TPA: sigma-70 family RNA polymerase sigma factor [Terriglobales bacterium]|nr:sigma-70 family RNA polymerase sigma factor [Terriglobales bacterium]
MDLLERFAQGEVDAFETLVRQFQGEIYGWIVRIVRDTGVAEDLTIETLWRVYKARNRFRPDASFGAWARRIATNLAIDYLRTRHSEQELVFEPEGRAEADVLEQQETRAKIQQAFRQLPAKLQVAATLALIEEHPYGEIADALGTSVGAVKLRVFRAVRILRKQLGPLWTKNRTSEVGR